ncbi:MAG: hypothetical protein Fur0024_4590 [Patescibacteria group bacterium]
MNRRIDLLKIFITSIFTISSCFYFYSFVLIAKNVRSDFQNIKISNSNFLDETSKNPVVDSINLAILLKNLSRINFSKILLNLEFKKISNTEFEISGIDSFKLELEKIYKIRDLFNRIDPQIETFSKIDLFAKFLPTEKINEILPKAKKATSEIFNLEFAINKIFSDFKILVLFQNPLESRPTGGFIGSFAYIEIKNQKLEIIEIASSYKIEDYRNLVEPPKELKYVYQNFTFRDSNFYFSFEDSAKKATDFFGRSVDSVVFVNPSFLKIFLDEVGEISIPEKNIKINSENIFSALGFFGEAEYRQNSDFSENSKNFLGELFSELLKKITERDSLKNDKFLKKILTSIYKRDVVFYFFDSKIKSLAKYLRIDGDLPNYDENYLSIIETNLGGSKSSWSIKKEVSIKISDNRKFYEIEMKFTHLGDHNFLNGDWKSFERFYIPPNVEEVTLFNFDEPPEIVGTEKIVSGTEGARFFVGGWINLKPNESRVLKVSYRLTEPQKDFLFVPQSASRNFFLKIFEDEKLVKEISDPVLSVKV